MGIVLLIQNPLIAMAETTAVTKSQYTTYGEYRSGSAAQKRQEADYTVIEIQSEEDLISLAEQCQVDAWSVDKKVQLNADIVLQERTDLCIPSFGGIFEGNGHTISRLGITRQGSVAGLFRYVQEGGSIRNLSVEGKVAPEGTQSQVGGIAGINYGIIYNCSFSGYVTGDSEVGGIAGVNESTGEIRKCQSDAVVTGNHSTGGIVGNNHGTLNHCSNAGDINTDSTEVSYQLEDITIESIEELNSTDNVAAHTDSGGIAGISDGKIYYCTNSGTVGYSHVGYNTGGIVGRLHQGYLQNCTNTGHILGRKDVGGIAGQMEPFLEVQYLNGKLQELDQETERFLDLLDTAHQDLSGYGKQAASLTKNLTKSLRNASAAGNNLTSTANALWYIYNNELTGLNQDLKALNNDWSSQSDSDRENGNVHDVTVSGGNAVRDVIADMTEDGLQGDSPKGSEADSETNSVDGLKDQLEDILGDITGDGADNGVTDDQNDAGADKENDINVRPEMPGITADSSLTIQVPNDTESYRTALRKFGDNATVHIDNMTQATSDRSGGISDNLNTLNKEMEAAGSYLEQLSGVLEAGTDKTSENTDALLEQARVLRRLMEEIRDDLFRYEGITVEDTSDESASRDPRYPGAEQEVTDEMEDDTEGSGQKGEINETEVCYDTTSFQQGKVTLCVNKGLVEADTNVGGIVGQIATEYDFDPEDDITLTGAESFDIEQTVKAVVRDSRNLGTVTGKKDCVGGIVGKAEFGAVISCESYGDISSTGGSNVGGIAGASSYAIRSCYTMGSLSGKNNVGGIAGKGCDIFYSYAYNNLELTGECLGAIAGSLEEDGTLCGNYYVEGSVGGIDGIGYDGGAAPLPYEEFCTREGVPKAFTDFTITFLADGEELASYHCTYGDSLRADQFPEIPEKEGYYAQWPEFDYDHITGNKVLEAVYSGWITSLAGAETDESGKAKLLVEGEFLPEEALMISEENGEISFTIGNNGEDRKEEYQGPVTVRVLCDDTEHTKVEVRTEEGFVQTDTEVMGSYLRFHMDAPGTFRMTVPQKGSMILWYGIAAAVILLILTIAVIKIRSSKKKRAKKDASGATLKAS